MMGAWARRMAVPARSRRLTVAYRWKSNQNWRMSGAVAREGARVALGVPGWRAPEYILR